MLGGFLQANELEVLRLHFHQLLHGLDSAELTFHWWEPHVEASTDNEYRNNVDKKVWKKETHTGYITEVSNHNVQVRPTQSTSGMDVQIADHVIYVMPDVELDRKGLWIEVPNLGEFIPDAKPVLGSGSRSYPIPQNRKFFHEIYCRMRRDGKSINSG